MIKRPRASVTSFEKMTSPSNEWASVGWGDMTSVNDDLVRLADLALQRTRIGYPTSVNLGGLVGEGHSCSGANGPGHDFEKIGPWQILPNWVLIQLLTWLVFFYHFQLI